MTNLRISNFDFSEKKIVYVKRALIILLSSLLYSISINLFIAPNKFLSGGVSGIALILQYVTGLNAGYTVILINIPLLIISLKKLDKEFTLLTALGTVSQSVFLILTRGISQYYQNHDLLLACICAGVINGFALGNIFKCHGSLGGTDIITMIVRRKANFNLGKVSFAINLVIVSIGSVIFGIEKGIYTLISMYINSSFVDQVIKGFNKKNLVFIVTSKEELIIDRITHDLRRSATILKGKGAYSKMEKTVIYCVVATSQIPRIKQIVEKTDGGAFMSILDASQVQGRGFDHPI
ncbi:YitT family protein [Clostridium thermarum]|uniref:YitT family protein n=1 Tax=Clostridium thermarum TaxID=1716543 RepID=UPI0013D8AC13|nr:YitT family protein [Clostridium thermarum]